MHMISSISVYVVNSYLTRTAPFFIQIAGGGTGITPMLQVIEAILRNPDDNTQVSKVQSHCWFEHRMITRPHYLNFERLLLRQESRLMNISGRLFLRRIFVCVLLGYLVIVIFYGPSVVASW